MFCCEYAHTNTHAGHRRARVTSAHADRCLCMLPRRAPAVGRRGRARTHSSRAQTPNSNTRTRHKNHDVLVVFEKSQEASRSIQDHSRVSPMTPGHHLNGPRLIRVASMFRHFLSLCPESILVASFVRHLKPAVNSQPLFLRGRHVELVDKITCCSKSSTNN